MILVIIISLITLIPLTAPGYFPMHDDLQVMRIFQLEKCFADGQIPCRWAPDMTFGYGQAMFNFYSAFPYYLGVLVRLFTHISILDTSKVLFGASLFFGSVGMYLLAREFFGGKGAIISGALYALAPYRAVNVYVRGALAESFSLAILPFLWLFIYKAIKKPNYNNIALLAILLGAFLVTHNVSTLMFFVFTALWSIFWLSQNFRRRSILALFLAGTLGLGLSAFFFAPVIFETSLVKGEIFVSGYSYFTGHFVSLKQLFLSRFWGFGGSTFGEEDGMSFQVGWPHWWIAIFVFALSLYKFFKGERKAILIPGLLSMALFALFLTHNKSTPLWMAFAPLSYIQFPWRFLGIAVFLISLASGGISYLKPKISGLVTILFVALAFLFNINYFKPERMYLWLTDEIKLSGVDLKVQQGAAFLDYLPKTVESPPLGLAPGKPEVIEGNAEILNFTRTSSTFFFDIFARAETTVDVPIIYFPDWEVYILRERGIKIPVYPSEAEGLVRVQIPEGKHMIYGRFANTPVRSFANAVTGASFLILIALYPIFVKKKNE